MELGLGLGISKGGFVTNLFRDATLAFSLRDLGLGATYVVRVRRDSDNVEQDFTATEITNGGLETFVGSANGHVTIWYNQKGGNNAIQNTATQQPIIIDTGNLVMENDKAALKFTQSEFLNVGTNVYSLDQQIVNHFSVQKPLTSVATQYVLGGSVDKGYLHLYSDTQKLRNATARTGGLNVDNGLDFTAVQHLVYMKADRDRIKSFANNVLNVDILDDDSNYSGNNLLIASKSNLGDNMFKGTIQEIALYTTDQENNRITIQNNINNYYGIY